MSSNGLEVDGIASDQEIIRILNRLVSFYGQQDWWEDPNRIADWVAMILIQQTNQTNAELALANLKGQLSLEALLAIDLTELEQLVYPAGFYRQKARYIKALMQWFADQGGEIAKFTQVPTADLRQELLKIKGVGQETADVMLLYIFERNVFICDQYAMRLFRRLGLGDYRTYSQMRLAVNHLVEGIPHKLCKEWHACIDVHGKHFRRHKDMDESWLFPEN